MYSGSVLFGLVRVGLVWFGGLAARKKGAKNNLEKCSWCPPTRATAETAPPAGSAGFGVVQCGLAWCGGQKGGKKKIANFLLWYVRFRFGGVRSGSAGVGGTADVRWPGGQEEKTPQVV